MHRTRHEWHTQPPALYGAHLGSQRDFVCLNNCGTSWVTMKLCVLYGHTSRMYSANPHARTNLHRQIHTFFLTQHRMLTVQRHLSRVLNLAGPEPWHFRYPHSLPLRCALMAPPPPPLRRPQGYYCPASGTVTDIWARRATTVQTQRSPSYHAPPRAPAGGPVRRSRLRCPPISLDEVTIHRQQYV